MSVDWSCSLSCTDRQQSFVKDVVSDCLDQKSSLSPPPPPPPPLPPSLLCPSGLSLIHLKELFSPSLSHSDRPLAKPPVPTFSPLEATWSLCSWCHGVWKAQTPAHGMGLLMSCQLVGPQGLCVRDSYKSDGL